MLNQISQDPLPSVATSSKDPASTHRKPRCPVRGSFSETYPEIADTDSFSIYEIWAVPATIPQENTDSIPLRSENSENSVLREIPTNTVQSNKPANMTPSKKDIKDYFIQASQDTELEPEDQHHISQHRPRFGGLHLPLTQSHTFSKAVEFVELDFSPEDYVQKHQANKMNRNNYSRGARNTGENNKSNPIVIESSSEDDQSESYEGDENETIVVATQRSDSDYDETDHFPEDTGDQTRFKTPPPVSSTHSSPLSSVKSIDYECPSPGDSSSEGVASNYGDESDDYVLESQSQDTESDNASKCSSSDGSEGPEPDRSRISRSRKTIPSRKVRSPEPKPLPQPPPERSTSPPFLDALHRQIDVFKHTISAHIPRQSRPDDPNHKDYHTICTKCFAQKFDEKHWNPANHAKILRQPYGLGRKERVHAKAMNRAIATIENQIRIEKLERQEKKAELLHFLTEDESDEEYFESWLAERKAQEGEK